MFSAQTLNRLVVTLERVANGIGMFAVITVMLTVASDTFLRYVMNAPIQWAYDVISLYLMVIIAYLPVSATFTDGRHVNVTLFYNLLPERTKAPVNTVIAFLIMGFGMLIAYTSLTKTWHSYRVGDVQVGYAFYAMWLSHLPIAAGFVVFSCRMVLSFALWLLVRNDPYVIRDGEAVE